MHMVDALVSPAVGLTMGAVSALAIGVAVAKVKKDELSDNKIPIMGIAGAMVFAGQMINFTIPATGSSGHLGGGILLAGLLGGIPAFLSIAAVLIIQCLFFADGGLLALGCNIFNIGAIPCLIVYPLLFKPFLKRGINYKNISGASVLSAIIALELGAFFVVLETLLSGITALPFGIFIALMLPIHLVIAVVEGLVTAAALCFIYKMRPEIIDSAHSGKRLGTVSLKKVLTVLAVLTLILGGALSLLASANPDGLEWAIDKTTEKVFGVKTELESEGAVFETAAGVQEKAAFLPDYAIPSHPENVSGTSAAGIAGAAITFIFAAAAGLVISKVKKRKKAEANV